MKQVKVGDVEYLAHIKALEEHKKWVDLIGEGHENFDTEEMNRALQKLVFTFEEYFKIIGIP